MDFSISTTKGTEGKGIEQAPHGNSGNTTGTQDLSTHLDYELELRLDQN